jgi:predicted RNA binding protein YcfA (HicA-like mRNA interferase family)
MKPVSGKRFCKVLEKHGWYLKRTTKSSHFIYTKPGNPATISVPVHGNKDLKLGLQADLMKQAGLTEDDL